MAAGKPKTPFFIVLGVVVVALIVFAVWRSDILAPKGSGDGGGGDIDPNKVGGQVYEAADSSAPTTVKEYKFVLREDKRRKRFVSVTCVGLAGCYARMGQFRTAATYLSRLTRPDPRLSTNPDFDEMKKDPTYRRFFPAAN